MNILQAIYSANATIVHWLNHFWGYFWDLNVDLFCYLMRQVAEAMYSVLATIPLPTELTDFTWPTMSSAWSIAFVQLGIPEAMSILAAAFTLKMTMRFLPLLLAA